MDEILSIVTTQIPTFLIGMVTGIFIHSVYTSKVSEGKSHDSKESKSEFSFSQISEEMKMVLVVRTDLKMGKGKIAAQCSHAALMAYEIARKQLALLTNWENCGQKKVVVKVESEDELLSLAAEAAKIGLVYAIVRDAGLTQVQRGTKTVLAVGPGPQKLIDKVTGHLALL